jgi:cytochrome bd-type quinol oxidase subunit 1
VEIGCHKYQPVKFAAIEARWHDEQSASAVLIAIPDPRAETNHYQIAIPVLGSLIGSMSHFQGGWVDRLPAAGPAAGDSFPSSRLE